MTEMVMSSVEKESFRVLKLAFSWHFGLTNLVLSNTVTQRTVCVCWAAHDDVAVVCGRGPWTLGASGYELYI